MSPELRDLLRDAAPAPTGLPSTEQTWAAGRRRRRRRMVAGTLASVLALTGGVVIGQEALDQPQPPEVLETPPATPASPEAPTDATPTEEPTAPHENSAGSLRGLAVGSTLAIPGGTDTDGGMTLERYLPGGTSVVGVDDGVAYPERLWGLPDGTVAWLGDAGVMLLEPDATEPRVLVPVDPADSSRVVTLAGTGQVDGAPVLLVTESRAPSPTDDEGGTLRAVGLDGTATDLRSWEVAWEYGIGHASARDGWLLTTAYSGASTVTELTAPDGTLTELAAGEEDSTPEFVLGEYDVEPGVAVVSLLDHRQLEIRSVLDPTGDPFQVIDLPLDGSVDAVAGGLAKQPAVAGEWAYVTLLPDYEKSLQVNLHSGQATVHDTPGLLAVHADLQPRSPDAGPVADCAAEGGGQTADAQAYVWFPCPDAATFAEGDDRARFFGIQKVALVTDPRASSGGIDQRVTAMLEAIFAGPDPRQEAEGYDGIIDPDVDALDGVTFTEAEGLLTVALTEEGAQAASSGSSARMVFEATVEAAIFGGFVDVDRVRITVEGDCERWALMGESSGCATRARDDTVSRG